MLKTLLGQVKEYRNASLITPVFMIGEVICEMVIPVLMGWIVDKGIYGGNMAYIMEMGLLMIIVAIVGLFCGFGGGIFGAKASTGLAKNLRKAAFENIQTYSFANIDKFSSSGLVTRLTTDITNIQNSYQMILRMAMRAPASMIIAMTMSFMINARIARIYLFAVIGLSIFLAIMVTTVTKYFRRVFERYDDLNESIQENVTAIRVVKAYVREEYENTKLRKAAQNIYEMFKAAEKRIALQMPVMQGTVYTCILLISWTGAHMIVQNELTTGELMSLLTYCMNILMSLMMISMVFVMITMSIASGRRVAEVIEEKSTITNPGNPIYDVPDGSIRFDYVSFAYNEKSKHRVLKGLNLEIESGESIGIIGGTGSGKTSFVNLISRLYDPTQGKVFVGGHDVREYDLDTLRNQVAVVLQKNVLFSGTILDNLRWGKKDATLEECKEACRMACADEFIEGFPDGYETFIEQGGSNLSGGQKQRLCIARALLKRPKILILDDSTSAVDTATDARIHDAFDNQIPDTTRLIIAQRISSIQNCDRIIVLDNGLVNGFGTHEELLANNDIYREVYESQTSGNGDFDEGD